jgi:hypothetical protein
MGDAALRAGDIAATRRNWEEAWHWAPAEAGDGKRVARGSLTPARSQNRT